MTHFKALSSVVGSAMPPIVIYTRPFCGYCASALRLLRDKGLEFTEIEAGFDPDKRKEMIARSGRSTFPQIFVGETHVGGSDDLAALEAAGEFDALLGA
jgi:glutaredoxin 3